jgi:hypothetical protein
MLGPNDGLPAANDSLVGANEKNHRGARTKAAYAHPNAVFLSRRVGCQHNKSKIIRHFLVFLGCAYLGE